MTKEELQEFADGAREFISELERVDTFLHSKYKAISGPEDKWGAMDAAGHIKRLLNHLATYYHIR